MAPARRPRRPGRTAPRGRPSGGARGDWAGRLVTREDINVTPEGVGHQHVDFVYYGEVEHRDIAPAAGEQDAADWEWFEPADLRARADELADDVVEVGIDAIEAVDATDDERR